MESPTAQTPPAPSAQPKKSRKPFAFGGRYLRAMALLAALALVLCGLVALKSLVGRRRLERSFAEFTRASPTLVIKRVGFSKYLARGSL
ncbi:MAG TPA: hypothetical protein PKO22_03730, partial [Treponemataceae bacterium]|nr:hypothetical protein [Treponemataceae bacterium]